MKNLFETKLRLPLLRLFVGLFALLALVSVAPYANAQSSVQFRISENHLVLKGALDLERNVITQMQYDTILAEAACQNPFSRLQARNRPFIMVQNTSTVADTITSVLLDLTEFGFQFGVGDVAGDGFNGLLALLSNRSDAGVQITSASFGSDNTQLRLNFSGLSQGQAAIFRFDIDEPNGPLLFPDFRQAIQGADIGNGPGELATLTTTFGSGAPVGMATFPQAGPLANAGHAENYHAQTMLLPPVVFVPEPTSVILLLSSFAGIATMRRRRK